MISCERPVGMETSCSTHPSPGERSTIQVERGLILTAGTEVAPPAPTLTLGPAGLADAVPPLHAMVAAMTSPVATSPTCRISWASCWGLVDSVKDATRRPTLFR